MCDADDTRVSVSNAADQVGTVRHPSCCPMCLDLNFVRSKFNCVFSHARFGRLVYCGNKGPFAEIKVCGNCVTWNVRL